MKKDYVAKIYEKFKISIGDENFRQFLYDLI